MNAVVKNIRGVSRIVDKDTGRIAASKYGFPLDGGRANCSKRSVSVAWRQARHINEATKEK